MPDRETTRRDILDAARALLVGEGCEAVSIRRIAERTEISAAAIYLYFPGKADILSALSEEGFRRLSRALAVPGTAADPLAALEEYFARYYDFGRRQPEFYWLMFVARSGRRIARDPEGAAWLGGARAHVAELIDRCVHDGRLPADTKASAAFDLLFAAVHGIVVLRLGGRFCVRAEADALARAAVRAGLRALQRGGDEATAASTPRRMATEGA